MSVDKLRLLCDREVKINDMITLRQPSLKEIADYGESIFFSVFYLLCSIPSDHKSMLWDAGIDFMKISDWELFLNVCKGLKREQTEIILGDLDFSAMDMVKNTQTGEVWLEGKKGIINKQTYLEFIPYLREIVGYVLKREKAGNKFTKMVLIEEDRKKKLKSQNEDYESTIFTMIMSLVNTEEFPYTYETVQGITLYQLNKSFIQIQNKKSACAVYQGSMSGFVDMSKVPSSQFQWTYKF